MYLRKDITLPERLFRKWNVWENALLLSWVAGVDVDAILVRGQQIRGYSLIYRSIKEYKLPYKIPSFKKVWEDEEDGEEEEEEKFQGAVVLDAHTGFYDESRRVFTPQDAQFRGPVLTLDFNSLYPSIMRSHNLCYSTFLTRAVIDKYQLQRGVDYWQRPTIEWQDKKPVRVWKEDSTEPCFLLKPKKHKDLLAELVEARLKRKREELQKDKVSLDDGEKEEVERETTKQLERINKHRREGVMSLILAFLITERKKVKKEMEKVDEKKEPERYRLLNLLQNALKVIANSLYGMTGTQKRSGMLPLRVIAETVTATGRYMIEASKWYCESHFNKKEHFLFDAIVRYGDTDSIFPQLANMDVGLVLPMSVVFALGEEFARDITRMDRGIPEHLATFKDVVNLEFEKAFARWLSIAAKRYAGMKLNQEGAFFKIKMSATGLEIARRDNCALLRDMMSSSLNDIVMKGEFEETIERIHHKVESLLVGDVNVSDLIISKQLSQAAEEYKSKAAHVELSEKLKKRGREVAVGSRIPYVVIKGTKKQKVSQLAEDPVHVMQNGIPIDYEWYLEHQLKDPMKRIFSSIVPAERLFPPTKKRKVVIDPGQNSMTQHLVQTNRCYKCHSVVSIPGAALCERHAQDREEASALRRHVQVEVEGAAQEVQRLREVCLRCTSNNEPAIAACVNSSCSTWYERASAAQKHRQALQWSDLSW